MAGRAGRPFVTRYFNADATDSLTNIPLSASIAGGLYLHGFVEKPAEPQILALKRSQRLGQRQRYWERA